MHISFSSKFESNLHRKHNYSKLSYLFQDDGHNANTQPAAGPSAGATQRRYPNNAGGGKSTAQGFHATQDYYNPNY